MLYLLVSGDPRTPGVVISRGRLTLPMSESYTEGKALWGTRFDFLMTAIQGRSVDTCVLDHEANEDGVRSQFDVQGGRAKNWAELRAHQVSFELLSVFRGKEDVWAWPLIEESTRWWI